MECPGVIGKGCPGVIVGSLVSKSELGTVEGVFGFGAFAEACEGLEAEGSLGLGLKSHGLGI